MIYRCSFACTLAPHCIYVDSLKGCSTLSKVKGYALILNISPLNMIDTLVLLNAIYSIPWAAWPEKKDITLIILMR